MEIVRREFEPGSRDQNWPGVVCFQGVEDGIFSGDAFRVKCSLFKGKVRGYVEVISVK